MRRATQHNSDTRTIRIIVAVKESHNGEKLEEGIVVVEDDGASNINFKLQLDRRVPDFKLQLDPA